MKKRLAIIGAMTAISAAGLTGMTIAHAASTPNSTNSMSSLVDAIASKFKLNKTDVQSVFDNQRATMEAQREQSVKDDVAQLVKDGKLTQAQADAINAKRAELVKEREADRAAKDSKTVTEHEADRDAHKTALDNWMKEKGISSDYAYLLMGGRGHGQGSMHGMQQGMRGND